VSGETIVFETWYWYCYWYCYWYGVVCYGVLWCVMVWCGIILLILVVGRLV